MKDNLGLIILGWMVFGLFCFAAATLIQQGYCNVAEFYALILLALLILVLMHFWFEVCETLNEIKEICQHEVSNFG